MNQASFKLKKSKLLVQLTKMTKTLGRISKWNKYTVLEITVTDGLLTLVIPGIRLELKCETSSTAKATLSLFYFKDIIQTTNGIELDCIITDRTIKMGGVSVHAKTTFFETDSILKASNYPLTIPIYTSCD